MLEVLVRQNDLRDFGKDPDSQEMRLYDYQQRNKRIEAPGKAQGRVRHTVRGLGAPGRRTRSAAESATSGVESIHGKLEPQFPVPG